MPKLTLDQFNEPPKVGDKVKVTGEVQSIDDQSGEVDVSYDEVSIVGKDKGKKDEATKDKSSYESLDNALADAFPSTQ